jgi:hypothetical protein
MKTRGSGPDNDDEDAGPPRRSLSFRCSEPGGDNRRRPLLTTRNGGADKGVHDDENGDGHPPSDAAIWDEAVTAEKRVGRCLDMVAFLAQHVKKIKLRGAKWWIVGSLGTAGKHYSALYEGPPCSLALVSAVPSRTVSL